MRPHERTCHHADTTAGPWKTTLSVSRLEACKPSSAWFPQGQPGNTAGWPAAAAGSGSGAWLMFFVRCPREQRRSPSEQLPHPYRRAEAWHEEEGARRHVAHPSPIGKAKTIERSRALARRSARGARLSAAAILLEAAKPARPLSWAAPSSSLTWGAPHPMPPSRAVGATGPRDWLYL